MPCRTVYLLLHRQKAHYYSIRPNAWKGTSIIFDAHIKVRRIDLLGEGAYGQVWSATKSSEPNYEFVIKYVDGRKLRNRGCDLDCIMARMKEEDISAPTSART